MTALIDQFIMEIQGSLDTPQRDFNESIVSTLNKEHNICFTTSVIGMEAISHVIEERLIEQGLPLSLYVGFQRFSRVKPQRDRYKRLLNVCSSVYLFGQNDVPLWKDPRLHLISFPNHRQAGLAGNWFLLVSNPEGLSMGLVAQEIFGDTPPVRPSMIYRQFRGFWTYNRVVIERLITELRPHLSDPSVV